MSRQHHTLKCETQYYQEVESGNKTFEIRKNDRDFKLYDMVTLEESVNGVLTGRKLLPMDIKYIFYGGEYGLDKDYCIFSFGDL